MSSSLPGERQRVLAADHQNHKIQARPKNWLMPVALTILRREPSHGYRLMERFEQFGFEPINPGTFYRTLRHLDKDGLCESEWDTANGGGPARRMYSITDAGEEYLVAWAERCESYQEVLDSFLRTYNKGVS